MAEHVVSNSPKKVKRKRKSSDKSEDHTSIKKPKSDRSDHVAWNDEADIELIRLIEENVNKRGRSRPKYIFPKHVDWKGIAESLKSGTSYDVDSVSLRARWDELSKQVRKLRTVPEMIDDVKKATKFHFDKIPKMPLTAYQLYSMSKRPQVREKYPDMPFSEISRRLGKKWRELPVEKRKKYERRAQERKEEYVERLKEWKLENPGGFKELNGEVSMKLLDELKVISPFDIFCDKKSPSIKEKYPDITEELLHSKLKRKWEKLKENRKEKYAGQAEQLNAEQKKSSTENNKKQKFFSSYTLFLQEKRKELLAEDKNLGFGEISKLCSKLWKELDSKERSKFEEKAKLLNANMPRPSKGKAKLKKPQSAYSIYFIEKRLELLKKNPNLEFGEIASLCGKAWKNLTKDEQESYKLKEKEMRKEYEAESEKVNENQNEN